MSEMGLGGGENLNSTNHFIKCEKLIRNLEIIKWFSHPRHEQTIARSLGGEAGIVGKNNLIHLSHLVVITKPSDSILFFFIY